MSDDLIAIIGCCILGLMAHGARKQSSLEWVLRVTYGLFLFGEILNIYADPLAQSENPWNYGVLIGCTVGSGLLLFKPGRQLFSLVFTLTNQIIAGRFILAAFGKLQVPVLLPPAVENPPVLLPEPPADAVPSPENFSETAPPAGPEEAEKTGASKEAAAGGEETAAEATSETGSSESAASQAQAQPQTESDSEKPETIIPAPTPEIPLMSTMRKVSFFESFMAERIFVAESIPHMNGLWIYLTTLAFLLTHMEMAGFQMPSIMVPLPVTMDQLFSYNFLGLIMLAVCGVGIIVTRSPREALRRLGLVKPSFTQVLIGVAGIFITFAYDYLWSTYSHAQQGLGYADKLSHYNEGTFTGGADPGPAFLVASATGLCAGLGEETLIRGALQPVLGIIPAAFMHGVLHGQFSHAPLLILQVFGWSTIMGILRRYTNTTTTIITHVGFNFLSTFLIAFNP